MASQPSFPRPAAVFNHGNPSHLLPPTYKRLVSLWLEEDAPNFDYGGFVVGDGQAEARLLGKSEGTLAGVPFFDEVFRQLDCTVEWHLPEGAAVEPIHYIATVRGPVRCILLGERVALNTLARCSGIATASHRLLHHLHSITPPHHAPPLLAGTRKTTPGFRLVEKYGLVVGGADPHRHDLSSLTMLKDNHVAARGGDVAAAVAAARAAAGFALKVEVEARDVHEALRAVDAGADVVMLDNFGAEGAREAARRVKARARELAWGEGEGEGTGESARGAGERGRRSGNVLVEVSGGMSAENIAEYVCEDVDIVSTSSVHQGVKHVDFSLKIVP